MREAIGAVGFAVYRCSWCDVGVQTKMRGTRSSRRGDPDRGTRDAAKAVGERGGGKTNVLGAKRSGAGRGRTKMRRWGVRSVGRGRGKIAESVRDCGNGIRCEKTHNRTDAHIVDRKDRGRGSGSGKAERGRCIRKMETRSGRRRPTKRGEAAFPSGEDHSREGSRWCSRHSPVRRTSCCTEGTPVSLRCMRPMSISTARPPILAGS